MTKPKDNICEEHLRKTYSYNPETGEFKHIRLNRIMNRKNADGYIVYQTQKKSKLVHRSAWFLYYGQWPNGYIDHINTDKADNRIENLREATHSENLANKNAHRKRAKIHSKYKGVYWHPRGKWMSRCAGVTLGYFNDEEEAKNAYDKFAKERYGQFYRK